MPRHRSQSGHSQIASAIVQIDRKMQLLELMKDGLNHEQIKKKMQIGDSALKELRNELLGELTETYVQEVDSFRMVALARYERLFQIADERARGVVSDELKSGERKDPVAALGIPDPKWFDRALQVLAAEQSLLKYDMDRLEKDREKNSKLTFNKISSVTLSGSDPMAKMAIEAMQKEWMEGADSPEAALLQQVKQAILPPEGEEDFDYFGEPVSEDPSLEELEEQLRAMQERLKGMKAK